jgi:NADH-quinone oxidoreductase subunit M
MLWMVQRVYYGPVTNEKNASLPDLNPREWAAAIPLCAAAIVMGVFPVLFLKPMEPSVRKMVEQVGYSQPVRVENRNREMQNAKVKMQTLSASPQLGDVRGVVQTSGR